MAEIGLAAAHARERQRRGCGNFLGALLFMVAVNWSKVMWWVFASWWVLAHTRKRREGVGPYRKRHMLGREEGGGCLVAGCWCYSYLLAEIGAWDGEVGGQWRLGDRWRLLYWRMLLTQVSGKQGRRRLGFSMGLSNACGCDWEDREGI